MNMDSSTGSQEGRLVRKAIHKGRPYVLVLMVVGFFGVLDALSCELLGIHPYLASPLETLNAIASLGIGVVLGWLVPRRGAVLGAIGVTAYYLIICAELRSPMYLWVGLQYPIRLIAVVVGAVVMGRSTR
ncbi:MAG TPA: hypothetical protein VMX94_07405 [Armatimonadota bacterium]|nr:hypothetical protein [Armatimonadota bacterium]